LIEVKRWILKNKKAQLWPGKKSTNNVYGCRSPSGELKTKNSSPSHTSKIKNFNVFVRFF